MSRVTDDPFVKALVSDFRSQNIKAKGASVQFFHHLEAFVRSIEREVECRERGHITAEVPRNAPPAKTEVLEESQMMAVA